MRVVFVTQEVDPEHAVLGATVAKIRALAERCDEVVVLAGGVAPGVLPDNCRVHLFRSRTRLGRGIRFGWALARELARRPRPVAVIAHMCPIYAVLAAPLARPMGVRVILWFAQWRRSRLLVAAERVSTSVVSVVDASVPIRSRKVVGIGHGIDLQELSSGGIACPSEAGTLRLLALGRYARSKGLMPIVDAVLLARARGADVRLALYGPVLGSEDVLLREELERRVRDVEPGAVELEGPVPRTVVPDLLASFDALVNNTRGSAPDKVVLEAGAAGLPVLVASPALRPVVEGLEPRLDFDGDDVDGLADRLVELTALTRTSRRELGAELRARVAADHSVGAWADRLLAVASGTHVMPPRPRPAPGRLVFVTQEVDPEHAVLGATVAKIRALAELCDEVVVLAGGAVPGVLPANCRVYRFRARTRIGRGVRFGIALVRELSRSPRPVAVVAHMCPIYAVLAAPVARPLGSRVLLWFTHWHASGLLRIAELVSNAVITVERRSFPIRSSKVHPIGHGIDLSDFPYHDHSGANGLALISLGRTSEAKGLDTVVRAVASVPGTQLVQAGPSTTEPERRERVALEQLASSLGVADRVRIVDGVPRSEVPALLERADALVNNMRSGATDKVVYEAAASGLPVIASNPALDEFLPPELRFDRDDPASLADRLRWLETADRAALGRALRERVERDHSVEGWADRVVAVACE